MVNEWIPDELKHIRWLSRELRDASEFDALLKPHFNVWGKSEVHNPRRWLLSRLIRKPERVSQLLPAGRRMFPEMTRGTIISILKDLLKDGYQFCKVADVTGKTSIRSYLVFIRGTDEKPWVNCRRCPVFKQCKIRKGVDVGKVDKQTDNRS
ncbi:hypothetical protein KAU30_00145 [Candidatus Bathyarchaeota archaeon]|nr:hypothetical protein [Candidatus Bathyarchaeota archaeon]